MDERQIIAKATEELQWTAAKLASIGYPGVAEVEQSVSRALSLLREKPDAPEPTDQAELEKEAQEAAQEEDGAIRETEALDEEAGGKNLSIRDELLAKSDGELGDLAKQYQVRGKFTSREDQVDAIMKKAGFAVHEEPGADAEIPTA